MKRKIIFLDIDGTLVNHQTKLPTSAKEAVEKARAKGHYVFLCTGRSRIEIVGDVTSLDFDGIVCAAGAHVEIGGNLIREEYISLEKVKMINNYFKEKGVEYTLEGPTGAFVTNGVKERFRNVIRLKQEAYPEQKEAIAQDMQSFIDVFIENQNLNRTDINKVSFYSIDTSFDEIEAYFSKDFIVLPNSMSSLGKNSGELMLKGVHKASGIAVVLDYLKIDVEDSFAYGDGFNDIEMLQYVANGIAMGNACEPLKAVAKDVTDNVDEDGLYNSFKKYGIID